MAIAFDAVTSYDNLGGSSFSHTCAATATILFVAARTGAVSGVTYNGVAMTQIQTTISNSDAYSLWYLVNPATGANTVAITGTGVTYAMAASYTGSRAASAIDVSGTVGLTSSSPLSVPLTTTRNNDWMVAFVFDRSGTDMTANTNCTKRAQPSNSASMGWFDSNVALPIGAYTMTVNEGGSSAGAIQAAFSPPSVTGMLAAF